MWRDEENKIIITSTKSAYRFVKISEDYHKELFKKAVKPDDKKYISEKIKDAQTFVNDIDETIDEIKADILHEQSIKDISYENIQNRIKNLLEDLPESFQTKYLKLKKLAPSDHTLSPLKDERCDYCGYKVSAKDAMQIENLETLSACKMCKRILIPVHSAY